MRIGVAKEIKPDEYRVALTPAGALELINHGHDVTVETGAGAGSSFPDDAYTRVGGQIGSVDEVWDSGTTIHAVTERVRQAGGLPTTVVLHYKPTHSRVPGEPDHFAETTDRWVVYPFKAGN